MVFEVPLLDGPTPCRVSVHRIKVHPEVCEAGLQPALPKHKGPKIIAALPEGQALEEVRHPELDLTAGELHSAGADDSSFPLLSVDSSISSYGGQGWPPSLMSRGACPLTFERLRRAHRACGWGAWVGGRKPLSGDSAA